MRKFFGFFEKKWVMWVGVGLAIIALLSRFLLAEAELVGHPDPGYFFGGAEEMARTGGLSDYYFAVFPYMTGYVGLLAMFFRWFGAGGFAVVTLNVLLEAVGIAALYVLVRKVSGSHKKGLWAAIAWCFNPFHFVFSALAMPIVAFDSALIVVALVAWMMWKERRNLYKFLGYSSLLGLVLAVAGWFRPTIAVMIIALLIFYVWGLCRDKWKGWWKIWVGLTLTMVVYAAAGQVQMKYAESVTGETGLGNYAGWSVFVGSNEVNNGGWNKEDAGVFWDDYLLNGYTIEEANNEVMKMGLGRYAERGVLGNVGFLLRKAWRLAGTVPVAAWYYVQGFSWGWTVLAWGWVWVAGCVGMFALGVVRGWKKIVRGGFLLFLVLGVLGMFSSGLLVEVMDRYAIPILAMMFLAGVVGVWGKKND